MKIFRISQTVNNHYDTYGSAIVAAPNEEIARNMYPDEYFDPSGEVSYYSQWCKPEYVTVEYIGTTELKQGVILASFNAG